MRYGKNNNLRGHVMQIEGIHVVRKKLSTGYRFYYYTFRGGIQFWAIDNEKEKQPYSIRFQRSYLKAIDAKPRADKSAPNTINSLIDDFAESDEYLTKTKETRKSYSDYFPAIRSQWGSAKIAFFENPRTRPLVVKWHKSLKDKPRAADMCLKAFKRLLNWSVEEGMIARHVCGNIKRIHSNDRSEIIWEADELDRLYKALPHEHARQIVRFAALTGLRRKDICQMPVTSDKGDWLEVKTSKMKVLAVIPVTGEVRKILNWFNSERQNLKHSPTTMFFSTRRRPYTPDGLSSTFERAKKAVGINKRFHDLRGTAVTNYALMDFSQEDIAYFIGMNQSTVKEIIHVYLDRKRVMKAKIIQMRAHK